MVIMREFVDDYFTNKTGLFQLEMFHQQVKSLSVPVMDNIFNRKCTVASSSDCKPWMYCE
jgi:hypothetical protein